MVQTRGSTKPQSQFSLLEALLAGNSSRGRQLLSQQGSLAGVTGPSGFSCLHAAALTDSHRLVGALAQAGVAPDAQIAALDGAAAFALRLWLRQNSRLPASKLCAVFRGVAPLHIAAWLGHQGTVQALLEAGADSEMPCLEGRTALAIACYFLDCRPKRSLHIIETLLAAGADPLCADFHGIGSLVLSPHCPPAVQHMLLDRVLVRYGGVPAPAYPHTRSGGGSGGSGSHAGEEAGPSSSSGGGGSQAAAAAAAGDMLLEAPPMHLPPDKHLDVLQASLCARHWPAFDFFLAATSADVAYPAHAVNRILSMAIVAGNVPLVLRIMRSGLRADAAGFNSQGQPHVAVAAVHGQEAVLDILCALGGSVTLKALHHATDTRSITGIKLLLARGRPPVLSGDAPVHIGGAHSRSGELCVMLRLLRDTAFRLRYCYRIDMPRHASESLQMVEALAEAGYQPTVYPQATVHDGWIDLHGRLVSNYDPTVDKPSAFDLNGVNRYTWLAAKQEPWTAARHAKWPPRFKQAVQQLLLVYHSGRPAAAAGSNSSGPLTRAAKRARLEFGQQRQPAAAAAVAAEHVAAPRKPAAAAAAAAAKGRKRGLRASTTRQQQPPPQQHGQQQQPDHGTKQRQGRQLAAAAPAAAAAAAAAACRPAVATLPHELLLDIIQRAAYPISAWM